MSNQVLDLPTAPATCVTAGRVPQWKRALDIGLILLSAPVTLPVMALIALLIKTVSRGPILFRQERVGFLEKPFICFKFRTMRVNASTAVHQGYFKQLMDSNEPMTKMDAMGDPRLIPLGSILRATGLDELPQLFNVLRGEMSLVGPRPCTPFEFANYHPWQKQRFKTLPGLTGLWQVNGKNKTTFNEMIRLDIRYVETKSCGTDFKIILMTFPAVFRQLTDMLGRLKRRRQRLN